MTGQEMTNLTDYKEMLETERAAVENYIEKYYSLKVPPPTPPTKQELSFWRLAGIEATLFTIASLGGAAFSAIRTGGFFYILENLLLTKFNISSLIVNGLSFISMILALLTFEGYLLADGFKKGKKLENVEVSKVGLWSAFGVIILAGVFAGTGLVEFPNNIEIAFNVIIAFLTAVASGVIVFAGGKNVGHTVTLVETERQRINRKHMEKWEDWNLSAVSSYNTAKYGNKARQHRVQSTVQNEQQMNDNVQPTVQNRDEHPTQLELSYEFVKEFVQNIVQSSSPSEWRIPTISEIENGAEVSRGTAYNALNKFIAQNSDKLLEMGIVDQDKVDKALEKAS